MPPSAPSKDATSPPKPGLLARLRRLVHKALGKRAFTSSNDYWERRYKAGGNSGAGSYGRLATFKAQVLNEFVEQNGIESLIEFGCGDGNQLTLAVYPLYAGLDVSPAAIKRCQKQFADDDSKRFAHYQPADFIPNQSAARADAAMSLDVIYHLIEDGVFHTHMIHLFDSADRFVVIYSSNKDERPESAPHVRHRCFTTWVETNRPHWRLVRHLPNAFPESTGDGGETSFADFFFFEKDSN